MARRWHRHLNGLLLRGNATISRAEKTPANEIASHCRLPAIQPLSISLILKRRNPRGPYCRIGGGLSFARATGRQFHPFTSATTSARTSGASHGSSSDSARALENISQLSFESSPFRPSGPVPQITFLLFSRTSSSLDSLLFIEIAYTLWRHRPRIHRAGHNARMGPEPGRLKARWRPSPACPSTTLASRNPLVQEARRAGREYRVAFRCVTHLSRPVPIPLSHAAGELIHRSIR